MRRPGPARRLATGIRIAVRTPAHRRAAFRSPQMLERRQERAVQAAVGHALRYVPYYRETARRLGLDEGDLRSAPDLARLPVIERAQVQEDPEYFVTEGTGSGETVTVGSGGTTGEPLIVKRDIKSLLRAPYPAARATQVLAGMAGTRRVRTLQIAPPVNSGGTLRRAMWSSTAFARGVVTSFRQASLFEPPEAHARAIDEFRPHVLSAYGSYLERLFVTWENGARPSHLPAVVVYGADALSDTGREMAGSMGIDVMSMYQSIEGGAIGFECELHRGHHVNADICPVRIVDADGRDVPDGESGEVVISNLENRGTVLLNYRQGDLARAVTPCECGRNLPMISLLEGRVTEWLAGTDGTQIHPQAVKLLLRMEASVRRYQVVQERPDRFRLSLVTAAGADREGLAARLERNFADQFGAGTATRVEFVDDIPRTPAGKVRPVVAWSP